MGWEELHDFTGHVRAAGAATGPSLVTIPVLYKCPCDGLSREHRAGNAHSRWRVSDGEPPGLQSPPVGWVAVCAHLSPHLVPEQSSTLSRQFWGLQRDCHTDTAPTCQACLSGTSVKDMSEVNQMHLTHKLKYMTVYKQLKQHPWTTGPSSAARTS